MRNFLPYNKINFKNKQLVGNKAHNLSFLKEINIPIASFFVITTDIFGKVINTSEIKRLLDKIGNINQENIDKNYGKAIRVLKQIQGEINKTNISVSFKKQLLLNIKELDAGRFAVRSSATCEDGINSSFAGQFESYLSVSKKSLVNAIKKCWSSVFTEQVFTYCIYHNIDFPSIKMAVIVQEMVFAQKGGVIFTEDIFTGAKDNLVIEAANGLGENIVSGIVNPHKVFFSKYLKKPLVNNLQCDEKVLNPQEAEKLFDIALKIEDFFKAPQDIEWAIEGSKVYILQSRPITR